LRAKVHKKAESTKLSAGNIQQLSPFVDEIIHIMAIRFQNLRAGTEAKGATMMPAMESTCAFFMLIF
jgi:hypothetical protein